MVVVQSLSGVQFLEPQGLQHTRLPWPSLSLGSLHKLMFIESVGSSSHLIFCHPLFLLPSTFPIRIFSSESAPHIKWSKSWSFSFSTSPSNEYSGLISFRIDWSDLVGQDREVEFYSRPLKSFEQKCDIIWLDLYMIALAAVWRTDFSEGKGR